MVKLLKKREKEFFHEKYETTTVSKRIKEFHMTNKRFLEYS